MKNLNVAYSYQLQCEIMLPLLPVVQADELPERNYRAGVFNSSSCFSPQVRLMLVLAPVMCILSGIGVSQVLTTYMKNLDISRPDKKSKKQQDSTYPIKNEVREEGYIKAS